MSADEEPTLTGIPIETTVAGCIKCGKMPAPHSALCPHCVVVEEYLARAQERRAEKARRTLDARKSKAAALAVSPLRSINPAFGKPASSWLGAYDEMSPAGRRR